MYILIKKIINNFQILRILFLFFKILNYEIEEKYENNNNFYFYNY